MNKNQMSQSVKGMLWMLAQTICMCAMMACVRHLSFEGFSGPQLVFVRAATGLLVLLPWVTFTIRTQPKLLFPTEWKFLTVRGLVAFCGVTAWFIALTGLSISDVVAVQFTHPLFVVIGAAFILREFVGTRRWIAVFAGILGVLIIIRPGYLPLEPLMICVLISAVSNASVQLITKHVAMQVSGAVMILYMNLVMAIGSLAVSFSYWIWPNWSYLVWMLAIGFFGTVAHIFLARAMKLADASFLGPVDFFRLPIASVFGWYMFGESSDLFTWIGAGVILTAVVLITKEKQTNKKSDCPDNS